MFLGHPTGDEALQVRTITYKLYDREEAEEMSIFADCQDARRMKTILEIDCPKCNAKEGIEVILQEGVVIGHSVCEDCGYVLPEGIHLAEWKYREEI